MSGVRTSKTVNGTTYNYTTLSGKVMRQQWDGKTLEFVYDDGNQPFAMIYNDGVDMYDDVFKGSFVKSVVFGLMVSFLAVYEGAQAKPTPEGVAQATTRTVVKSSLLVLALDFVLTALMFN